MVSLKKKSFVLLTVFLVSFFTVSSTFLCPKPVKAFDMAMDLNDPTHISTKVGVVAALVAYMGVRFAVQTSEIKSKVQDWVSSGKYALEQTTTGAINVTNSLIYQLKQSASSLVAEGLATWDSGSGGSLVSGQTVNWDSSVSSATDYSDVGNYMNVSDAVNAINETNDKIDSTNSLLTSLGTLIQDLDNKYTFSYNVQFADMRNSAVQTASYAQTIMYGTTSMVNDISRTSGYLQVFYNYFVGNFVNMLGSFYGGVQNSISSLQDAVYSVQNSVYSVQNSVNNLGSTISGRISDVQSQLGSIQGTFIGELHSFESDVAGDLGELSGTIEGNLENVKTSVDAIPQDFLGTNQNVNLQPLKVAGDAFTTRFPFSLPWDLYNSFSSLSVDSVKPDFDIDTSSLPLASICGLNKISIDLSDYNDLFALVKFFELLAFDIGLIFATRKLVGGDV